MATLKYRRTGKQPVSAVTRQRLAEVRAVLYAPTGLDAGEIDQLYAKLRARKPWDHKRQGDLLLSEATQG